MSWEPSPRFAEFLDTYANWRGLNTVCVTFDVDFAPDYMIENVVDTLARHQARATFFSTHASPLLQQIANAEQHEVGLHPNLSPGSSQGDNFADILASLRQAYPQATGNRFHRLQFGYHDLVALSRVGFVYDVSTLHVGCPYVVPAHNPDLGMTLLTYVWEDGICENAGLPMRPGCVSLDSPGLKVLNFHPMNVFINGEDAQARLDFLKENPDLLHCPRQEADRHRRTGAGAGRLLEQLLGDLCAAGCQFLPLRELVAAFRQATEGP